VAAAPIGSLNVTLIGDLFTGNERSAAMGHNAAVLSIGTASYPIIGGALATAAWNYPFLLPYLSIIVALLVAFTLKNPEVKNKQKVTEYFRDILSSLKNRQLQGLFTISVLTFIILYGPYLTYLPFIIRDTFHEPPYVIGIVMSFASIASFTASNQLGRLARRFSERKLIITACFLYILSMIAVPFVHNVWLLTLPAVLFGMAQGLNLPSLLSLIASLAPMQQRGAIMSLNGMLLRLGQTLGPLIIVPVFAGWGLSGAFFLGSVVAGIMLIIGIFFLMAKSSNPSAS
jgi:MFS family permease